MAHICVPGETMPEYTIGRVEARSYPISAACSLLDTLGQEETVFQKTNLRWRQYVAERTQ